MCADHLGVRLACCRPGKPTGSRFVETFNGSLRNECLNATGIAARIKAQGLLEAWRPDYGERRPHSAGNDLARQNLPV
ncbi:MAG TPA: transposase [Roseateles sp.]|uniref:integrase core domain-containing protein n=1 Tax=Roseateles sp. TaxID=1971397 RepID=UPI002ED9E71A